MAIVGSALKMNRLSTTRSLASRTTHRNSSAASRYLIMARASSHQRSSALRALVAERNPWPSAIVVRSLSSLPKQEAAEASTRQQVFAPAAAATPSDKRFWETILSGVVAVVTTASIVLSFPSVYESSSVATATSTNVSFRPSRKLSRQEERQESGRPKVKTPYDVRRGTRFCHRLFSSLTHLCHLFVGFCPRHSRWSLYHGR